MSIIFNMPTEAFNKSNPEQLIYTNSILEMTALGGIKIDGLDRMRVTLKVKLLKSDIPPVRHNLDLYNDTQLEKFTRKCAEKLEIGTNVLIGSFGELTEQLEKYRLQRQTELAAPVFEKPTLSAKERKQAETFLRKDKLMQFTSKKIQASGIVGEENNALLMFLIFTSRKRDQPLHIVSLGASGMGKTHLQESVGELITTLSENAFYYFGQRELKHKLILIEDLDGAENVLYPLRELQSKKRISKTIAHKNTKGETRTVHLIVEGPVSVAGCTTKEQIYEDNANRSFLVYLDDSPEQDQRIMNYQRRASAGKIDKQTEHENKLFLQNVQRVLEPIKVVNPFAEALQIPGEVFKPRRTNNHYLQFIEVITYYKQFQKRRKVNEATGEIYIETTIDDIEDANKLLGQVLLRKSDTITGACRNHFEKLKLYLIGQEQKKFTNREIALKFRLGLTTVKDHNRQLFDAGYLRYEKDIKSKAFLYEVVSYEEYNNLQSQVSTVLDNCLVELQKPNGRPSDGSTTRLNKSKKDKELQAQTEES
jgi:hypothetical protein